MQRKDGAIHRARGVERIQGPLLHTTLITRELRQQRAGKVRNYRTTSSVKGRESRKKREKGHTAGLGKRVQAHDGELESKRQKGQTVEAKDNRGERNGKRGKGKAERREGAAGEEGRQRDLLSDCFM